MADRIAIMRSGKIVQIGTPTEMYRTPANRFVDSGPSLYSFSAEAEKTTDKLKKQ